MTDPKSYFALEPEVFLRGFRNGTCACLVRSRRALQVHLAVSERDSNGTLPPNRGLEPTR